MNTTEIRSIGDDSALSVTLDNVLQAVVELRRANPLISAEVEAVIRIQNDFLVSIEAARTSAEKASLQKQLDEFNVDNETLLERAVTTRKLATFTLLKSE